MRWFFAAFILIFLRVDAAAQPQKKLHALSKKLDAGYRQQPTSGVAINTNAKRALIPGNRNKSFFHTPLPRMLIQADAAANSTIRSDRIHPGGWHLLSLNGSGETIAIWDLGKPRPDHQELSGRVTVGDTAASVAINSHATFVSGAASASGIDAAAKGSAPAASITSYDWYNDTSEMAYAAGNGLTLSVHPYAESAGWVYNLFSDRLWVWYADTSYSSTENATFGFYGDQARYWDEIAQEAPDYLIVKAAGNLNGKGPDTQPVEHWIPFFDETWQWKKVTVTRPLNGGEDGFETISHASVAKNVLTVGSVQTIPGGYSAPSDVVLSTDSGTGPTDEGRIKPDISVPGVSLSGPSSSTTLSYTTGSGTSYAAGVAAGAAATIRQHLKNLYATTPPAALLKSLMIHSAFEAGNNPGPDYKFGWGLLNTAGAVRLVSAAFSGSPHAGIIDTVLNNGETFTFATTLRSSAALKVTVCWSDPPGDSLEFSLNPSVSNLKNDLDLRVDDGTVHFPWRLSRSSPAAAAVRNGDNAVDNIEQILIDEPEPEVTITVTHKGTLTGGIQRFSLVWSAGEPLAETKITGAAGWRILGWPVSTSPAEISRQLPVQGISGGPGSVVNLYTSYNGSAWQAPGSMSAEILPGAGFLIYVFNNSLAGSRPLPFTLAANGMGQFSDVSVTLHTGGDGFNLIGNPFDAALDFGSLSADGSIQSDGQVWDNVLGWKLTSDIGDSIGAFQGFFVENNDASTLTFPVSARIAGGKLRKQAVVPGFAIMAQYADQPPNPDGGFQIRFYPDAETGRDPRDASKQWPLGGAYTAVYGRQDGKPAARLGLPDPHLTPMEIPVFIKTAGSRTPEFSITGWSDMPLAPLVTIKNPVNGVWQPVTGNEAIRIEPAAAEGQPAFIISIQPSATDIAPQTGIPATTQLSSYPNPANPDAVVLLTLSGEADVALTIADLSGRTVGSLYNGRLSGGEHRFRLKAGGFSSGVYLLIARMDENVLVRKMLLLK